jgi:hippurate hydrolase
VRARIPADRKNVAHLMQQIATGIGSAHGVTVTTTFNTEFIEAINAPEPTQAVVDAALKLNLETIGNRDPMSFSEDFANFSAAVPGCFLLLGNGEAGPNCQPLHSADYDFNDALLPIGRDFWVQLVCDRLPVTGTKGT